MSDRLVAAEFEVADLLIDRLRDGQSAAPDLNRPAISTPYVVALGALDVAGLARNLKSPAAVVVPTSEDAAESVAPQATVAPQYTRMIIAVETLIKAPNDRTGTGSRGRLGEVIGQSRALCAGWRPVRADGSAIPGVRQALQLRRGALVEIDGSWVAWRDEYLLYWWHASPGRDTRVESLMTD